MCISTRRNGIPIIIVTERDTLVEVKGDVQILVYEDNLQKLLKTISGLQVNERTIIGKIDYINGDEY